MPRKNHRLIKVKSPFDLKTIIEQVVIEVEKNGGRDNLDAINKQLFDNVFSFLPKIAELAQEEVNLIWESAAKLSKEILKKKPDLLVDEIKSNKARQKKRFLIGKYWIFPKGPSYVKCDDHIKFAKENSDVFVDGLGINGLDFIHATSSGEFDVIPLILSAGGIIVNFVKEGMKKTGRFQLCQCSLPWLKGKLTKMPIFKSHIRVVDPHKPYSGEKDGIYFIFRRPKKIKIEE